MIPVSLIDSSPMMEYGIKQMISEREGCEILFHRYFSSGNEAVDNLEDIWVDLLLIDLHLPDIDVFDLIKYIKSVNPRQKICIYTYFYDDIIIMKSVKLDIQGVLSKTVKICELIDYIKIAFKGERFITSGLLNGPNINTKEIIGKKKYETNILTKRELEIYNLLFEGLRNKDISELLGISINTVEFHRKNIYLKLNVKNITELIKHTSKETS